MMASAYKFKKDDNKFKDIEDLCIHNANIASSIGMYDASLTWIQLKDVASELKVINQSAIVSSNKATNNNVGNINGLSKN